MNHRRNLPMPGAGSGEIWFWVVAGALIAAISSWVSAAEELALAEPEPPAAEAELVRGGRLLSLDGAPVAVAAEPAIAVNLAILKPYEDSKPAAAPAAIASPAPAAAKQAVLSAIEREAQETDSLRGRMIAALRASLPGGGDGVIFGEPQFPPNLEAPAGKWTANFEFKPPSAGVGNVLCTVALAEAGRPVRKFQASVTIDRVMRGVQATRVIRRGDRIGEGDLVELEARLTDLPPDAMPDAASIAGTSAKSEIRPGVWMTGRMLALPPVVKPRQLVTVNLVNGAIRVTAKGIAKQAGARGELIKVENVDSKREMTARVVDGSQVEVIF